MAVSSLFYQWIDVLWLPVAWITVHSHQRVKASIFIAACILTLRTQVELMESIHAPTGLLKVLHSDVYPRGLIVYGVIIALFLLLAWLSPGTRNVVFFAASLSIYIFAFCASMLVMVF
jgi:hypothetical protein